MATKSCLIRNAEHPTILYAFLTISLWSSLSFALYHFILPQNYHFLAKDFSKNLVFFQFALCGLAANGIGLPNVVYNVQVDRHAALLFLLGALLAALRTVLRTALRTVFAGCLLLVEPFLVGSLHWILSIGFSSRIPLVDLCRHIRTSNFKATACIWHSGSRIAQSAFENGFAR